jgi:hypothetical protein
MSPSRPVVRPDNSSILLTSYAAKHYPVRFPSPFASPGRATFGASARQNGSTVSGYPELNSADMDIETLRPWSLQPES